MFDYSRFVHIGVLLVVLFQLNDCLMTNVTVVECEVNICTLSCFDDKSPFVWKHIASYKDPWRTLKHHITQNITPDEDGYYYCVAGNNEPSSMFYFVGKKIVDNSSSGVLIAVIVLAVLFGMGFVIMVALSSSKFFKGHLAKLCGDGVTVRKSSQERTSYDEVTGNMTQSCVDDDDYVVPRNPDNSDSDYLEVLPNHSTRTPSCGPLYENLENIQRARMMANPH